MKSHLHPDSCSGDHPHLYLSVAVEEAVVVVVAAGDAVGDVVVLVIIDVGDADVVEDSGDLAADGHDVVMKDAFAVVNFVAVEGGDGGVVIVAVVDGVDEGDDG